MTLKAFYLTRTMRAALIGVTVRLVCVSSASPQLDQPFVRSQDYFRDVISLSETLGKAHSIRVLCNGRNDQYWRSYMLRLLELEAPYGGGLRSSMVNGFNAGFSSGQSEHRACSNEAVAAEKIYAETGQALANQLAAANIPVDR
jgi:uncharacterized protein (TIGR02301 family)